MSAEIQGSISEIPNIVGEVLDGAGLQGELNPVAILAGLLTEGSVVKKQNVVVKTGTFQTSSSGASRVIVSHDIGKKPVFIIWCLTSSIFASTGTTSASAVTSTYQPIYALAVSTDNGESYTHYGKYIYSASFGYYTARSASATRYYRHVHSVSTVSSSGSYSLTNIGNFTFEAPVINKSGYSYRWYAIVLE